MERWADIADTDGIYQVSTEGRVRRTCALCAGRYPAFGIIPCRPNLNGYPVFTTIIARKSFVRTVHRLVTDAFLGPIPAGLQRAHLNGNKLDARLENLAFVTPRENAAHKKAHGTCRSGQSHHCAKLSEAMVAQIKARLLAGEWPHMVARDYPVCRSHVSAIGKGKVWAHVLPHQAEVAA